MIVKNILFVFCLCLISSRIHAQFSMGPKIGVGISTFTNVKINNQYLIGPTYQRIITPQLGLMFNIRLGKVLSLRPELLYNQRGYSATSYMGGPPIKLKVLINYIELPLNLVVGADIGKGRLEVFGGPSFAFGRGGKGIYEYTYQDYRGQDVLSSNNLTIKTETKPEKLPNNTLYFNPFNASLNVGMGYSFKGLVVQLSYNLGLTNIQPHYENSDKESKRSDLITKSSSYVLGVAYFFGKKQKKE